MSKLQLVIDMYDYKMKNDRFLWRLLIAQKDKQLEAKEQKIQELMLKGAGKGFSFDMMEDFPSVQQIQQRYRTLVQEDRQDLVDCLSELHEETLVKSSIGKMIQECYYQSSKTFLQYEAQMVQTVLKNVGFAQDTSILQNSFASWCRKNFKQATIYNQLKKTMEKGSAYHFVYSLTETPSLKSKWDQFIQDCCTVCWWMQCSANKLTLFSETAKPVSYPSLMGPESQVLLREGKITE
jgi:hypothetical protein